MVYLPNLETVWDNEVSIVSYIHRLDIPEEQAKLLKKHKVTNITELLKKEIQSTGNMRKLLKAVESNFVSAKNLDYDKMKNEEKIQTKMLEHGMMLQFQDIIQGTSVDLYRYTPSIGLKMAKVKNYVEDVEQVLGVSNVRVLAPIPNSSYIGFEVPREERVFVKNESESENLAIGVDVLGKRIELNIEEMPHLLVAGTTGSGKSVFLEEIIRQVSGKYNVVICDPKGVDFSNAIHDKHSIYLSLKCYQAEMERRFEVMKEKGVRKWKETGEKSDIIVIDEYNDLYTATEKIQVDVKVITKVFAKGVKEVKTPVYETIGSAVDKVIKKLVQKSRAAGIHIILATQRPSVKVIDGEIKANFPTRVCFRLPSAVDSKVVLDEVGAEKLLGKGDGLLMKEGNISRFQAFSN
jgi:S-DNA-T family DNA segregation ATPase FtsK/SpoIIIE